MHSILTTLLNDDKAIVKTAASLLPQLTDDVEWVIKNSAMRTNAELIKISQHPRVKVIYQRDSSLYEGLNQGLEHCEGQYVQIVGAGDEFRSGAIDFVLDLERKNEDFDSIFLAVIQKRNGREIVPNPIELKIRMACPHPGSILKLEKIKELKGFNENYRIASDYDLICRYIQKNPKTVYSKDIVVEYEGGGISEQKAVEGFLEEELIRIRVWGQSQVDTVLNSVRFFNWAKSALGV